MRKAATLQCDGNCPSVEIPVEEMCQIDPMMMHRRVSRGGYDWRRLR
jgi:hypothetical protein